ncbi:MAG: hypothetical protein R6W77_07030 [Trueperaceae bacterium]
MKRPSSSITLVSALLAAIVLLAGCGLVPPIDVQDPLGLDGQEIDVTFGPAVTGLAPLSVGGNASASFTFPDADLGDLPVNPKQIVNELGIASATLDREAGPEIITLSDIDVVVRVWQGAASYDTAAANQRAEASFAASGAVTLSASGGGVGTTSYTVSGASGDVGLLTMSGSDIANLLTILSELPATNDGSIAVTLQGDPDALLGGTLTIELDAWNGQIKF